MNHQIKNSDFQVYIDNDSENFYRGYKKALQDVYLLVMSVSTLDDVKDSLSEMIGEDK